MLTRDLDDCWVTRTIHLLKESTFILVGTWRWRSRQKCRSRKAQEKGNQKPTAKTRSRSYTWATRSSNFRRCIFWFQTQRLYTHLWDRKEVFSSYLSFFCVTGKGEEFRDLDKMMKRMEHWAHRLYPKLPFDDVMARISQLGKKKNVQVNNCVKFGEPSIVFF